MPRRFAGTRPGKRERPELRIVSELGVAATRRLDHNRK
jgi:hypothetical protein